MPPDKSFWIFYFEKLDALSLIPEKDLRKLQSWSPERSNCPDLTEMMEDFIDRIPDEWKATARNIFVGRVPSGEMQAEAWTEKQAGVIEINIQFTWILAAYVTAFDEFFQSIRAVIEAGGAGMTDSRADALIQTLEDRLAAPWADIAARR